MVSISNSILLSGLFLVLSHCEAFVGGRSLVGLSTEQRPHLLVSTRPHVVSRPLLFKIRGGGSIANESTMDGSTTFLATGDYSEVARSLFANFLTPATLLITCLVPLTTQQVTLSKLEKKGSLKRKLRGLYYVVSLLATCSELIAIIYASIASSRLLQQSAPATSAFALIERDFELPWIATTVHFIGGLMGFLIASGLGAYLSFPKGYNTAGACFAAASLLWVTRLANTRALSFSNGPTNCMLLLKRYIVLAVQQLQSSRPSKVGYASVVLTVLSIALTIRALLSSDDE